jgi:hypothetical protein
MCPAMELEDLPMARNSREPYDLVLGEIGQAATGITKEIGFEELFYYATNCQFHDSAKTMKELEDFLVTFLPHPTYSPGISLAIAGLCDRARV